MGRDEQSKVDGVLGPGAAEPAPWEGRVELGLPVVELDANSPPHLTLTFADGFKGTVSLQHVLEHGPAFAGLRDPAVFRKAQIVENGSVIAWGDDEWTRVDLCVDSLRLEAEGLWDPVSRSWTVDRYEAQHAPAK
ncbi:MAG: hypothetical protein AAGJ53_06265 [Pseudomonadota bacterium]